MVDGPPDVGGTLFSAMHLLYHRARRAAFSLWDSRLPSVLAFGAAPPPPPLGFCFLAIFSVSLGLPFRVVTSAVRATNSTPLLYNDPPDVIVDVVSVHVLIQCKLQNLVNDDQERWALVLIIGLFLVCHVLNKVGVLAELKVAQNNFWFIAEYHAAGFK